MAICATIIFGIYNILYRPHPHNNIIIISFIYKSALIKTKFLLSAYNGRITCIRLAYGMAMMCGVVESWYTGK